MSILLNRIAPRPAFFMAADDGGGPGGEKPAAGDAGGAAAAAAAAAAAGGDKGGAPAAGAAGGEKPAAGSGTIAGGDKSGAAAAEPVAGKWPENWRQELAGQDKAALKTLERYADPTYIWKALNELRGKVSSGELKAISAPPEGATPEQLTAWKKEQNLPEKPEGYIVGLKLPDGVVPGEADKPLLDSVAKMAFDKNIPQETVNTFTSWFYQMQDQQLAQREENDGKFHDVSLTELSQEWGKETKVNQNYLANLGSVFPAGNENEAGAWDLLLTARTSDGRIVGDHPAIVRGLVAAAREAFPAASVVPAGSTNPGQDIAGEMAALDKYAREDHNKYMRDPIAQARMAELIDAQIKMKNKAA